jgi:hypothetical protein
MIPHELEDEKKMVANRKAGKHVDQPGSMGAGFHVKFLQTHIAEKQRSV